MKTWNMEMNVHICYVILRQKGQRARGVWEEFKSKAFDLLMGMTKRRERPEKHAEDYIPILGLEYMLMGILREGTPPSVEKTREMDRIKEEIKEARKKLRPAAGQNALGKSRAGPTPSRRRRSASWRFVSTSMNLELRNNP